MSNTHRHKLQKCIADLQAVYDQMSYLRDHSTLEMQEEYNNVRRKLPDVWKHLQNIDNNLIPQALADTEL